MVCANHPKCEICRSMAYAATGDRHARFPCRPSPLADTGGTGAGIGSAALGDPALASDLIQVPAFTIVRISRADRRLSGSQTDGN